MPRGAKGVTGLILIALRVLDYFRPTRRVNSAPKEINRAKAPCS
jgi:hypothetical protein